MGRARLLWPLAVTVLLAPGLGGCGFTPLYAAPGVSSGLSNIDVVAPQGRVGYLIREDLDDALGHDKSAAPAWRLEYSLAQTRSPRGLSLADVADRYEVGLTVKYRLTNIATGQMVHAGEVATQVSYDAANAPYAGIAARQDSQERVASEAARQIGLELAAWMARRPRG